MTTSTLDRAAGPSSAAVAPAGATPPAGVDLPADYDLTRVYLPAPAVYLEAPYVFPAGPANPNSRTLADVVKGLNL